MKKEGSLHKLIHLLTVLAAAYGVLQMVAVFMMREGKRLEENNKEKRKKRYLSFMNGTITKFTGEEVEEIDLTCIMGGTELDLTGAALAPKTMIHLHCVMAGVTIKVPPMVEVRDDSHSVMSGVANMVPQYGRSGLPLVIVESDCIMSGVRINVEREQCMDCEE